MTARDQLALELTSFYLDVVPQDRAEALANSNLDRYAHELAEQIRANSGVALTYMPSAETQVAIENWTQAYRNAADLIDPEVDK